MNRLLRTSVAALAIALPLIALVDGARAYDTYTGTQCAVCHPGFVGRGALHDLHMAATNTCGICHPGNPGSKPVSTSVGAVGSSCAGCHGRNYGGSTGLLAAGLRAHHALAGVTICSGCHRSDPTPLAENVAPPQYSRGDVNVKSPCSSQAPPGEDLGTGSGLDNDGDGLYDEADPDCQTAAEVTTWGRIKAIYE